MARPDDATVGIPRRTHTYLRIRATDTTRFSASWLRPNAPLLTWTRREFSVDHRIHRPVRYDVYRVQEQCRQTITLSVGTRREGGTRQLSCCLLRWDCYRAGDMPSSGTYRCRSFDNRTAYCTRRFSTHSKSPHVWREKASIERCVMFSVNLALFGFFDKPRLVWARIDDFILYSPGTSCIYYYCFTFCTFENISPT